MTPSTPATVHLLAGLNAAGKTTYARSLAHDLPAVTFTLDEWVLRLHGLPYEHPDYPRRAKACTDLIWDTARQVLATGTDVVLDWNQWNRQRRERWRDRALEAGHRPLLHHLAVSVETAVERAQERSRSGTPHAHVLDEDAVRHPTGLFEAPTEEEGMTVHLVRG